jgi:putative ABC transport system substrate-binding protein
MNSPHLRRREVIRCIAAASLFPAVARAESQPAVIGILGSASADGLVKPLLAYREGLAQLGYQEGRNIRIEYRWADNRYDRLPGLAAELVRLKVAVILASGGPVSALAAKKATSTIPIVFPAISNAVELGLVESYNKPGGNVTGIDAFPADLDAKRLELLHELVPSAELAGVLINPNRPFFDRQVADIESAARKLHLKVIIFPIKSEQDFASSFEAMAKQRAGSLLVPADPFLHSRRVKIVELAAAHALPAIYQWRDFVVAGGLMSYGASLETAYRQAGVYTGRILKGTRPAELPVERPTMIELTVNLKTARTLGLTIPQSILARIDEVIE